MYVCMYVHVLCRYMYVRMRVFRMYVCMYINGWIYIYTYVYIYIYVCVHKRTMRIEKTQRTELREKLLARCLHTNHHGQFLTSDSDNNNLLIRPSPRIAMLSS